MQNESKIQQYSYYEMMHRRQNNIYAMFYNKLGGFDNIIDYYLKFTALEDNSSIGLISNIPNGKELAIQPNLAISYDAVHWFKYNPNTIVTIKYSGDCVYFCATEEGNERFADIGLVESKNGARNATVLNNSFYYFQMTGKIAASGSIMSLLSKDPFKAEMKENPIVVNPNNSTGAFTFFGLFYNCEALVKAPNLSATKLASHCYDCMFRGCTSLEEMPDLLATYLPVGCYMHMFNGCNSLVKTKRINAIQINESACYGMFWSCENLEEAILFNNSILENADTFGIRYMFYNCVKLRKGPNIYVDGKVGHATCNSMFQGCSLTGVPIIHIKSIQNRSGLYGNMFKDCKQLSSVPIDYLQNSAAVISNHLSVYNSHDPDDGATAQSINVKETYSHMFENCTSLTSAPFLYECALSTAKYASTNQYNGIFMGCTQLSSLSTDFTKYDANFKDMLKNASPTGILWCKELGDLQSHKADIGIGNGWEIKTYNHPNTFSQLFNRLISPLI